MLRAVVCKGLDTSGVAMQAVDTPLRPIAALPHKADGACNSSCHSAAWSWGCRRPCSGPGERHAARGHSGPQSMATESSRAAPVPCNSACRKRGQRCSAAVHSALGTPTCLRCVQPRRRGRQLALGHRVRDAPGGGGLPAPRTDPAGQGPAVSAGAAVHQVRQQPGQTDACTWCTWSITCTWLVRSAWLTCTSLPDTSCAGRDRAIFHTTSWSCAALRSSLISCPSTSFEPCGWFAEERGGMIP